MAIYLQLAALLVLFFVSYQLCGKDFFTPCTMLTLVFAFSTVCAIYMQPIWGFHYENSTAWLILSLLTISVVIGVIANQFVTRTEERQNDAEITPVAPAWGMFSLLIIMVTLVASLWNILRVTGGMGGALTEIMVTFRQNTSLSTDMEYQTPQWLKLLKYATKGFEYLYGFELIWFWDNLSKSAKGRDILCICLCILIELLGGARFGVAAYFVCLAIIWHFTRIRKRGYYRQYTMKQIAKVFLLVLSAFLAFYMVRNFVGRDDDSSLLSYVSHYFGGGVVNFDDRLKSSSRFASVWGERSFYSLINNLRKLGILDIDYYTVHAEWNYMNGHSLGNVYTAFGEYHYDFGMPGVFLLHILFSLTLSFLYETVKKNQNYFAIILFGTVYNAVALYAYNAFFFSNCICLGFVIQSLIYYVLYELMLCKRIQLRQKIRIEGPRIVVKVERDD